MNRRQKVDPERVCGSPNSTINGLWRSSGGLKKRWQWRLFKEQGDLAIFINQRREETKVARKSFWLGPAGPLPVRCSMSHHIPCHCPSAWPLWLSLTFTLPLINQSLCYLDSASLPQTSGTPSEDKTENLTHQFCGDWCHGLHPSKALSSWVTTPPCPPFHPLGWLRQPQLQATHAGLFVPDKVQRSQRVPDKIPRNCGPWYCCMPG